MTDHRGTNTSWALREQPLPGLIASVIGLGLWWSRIAVSDLLGTTAALLDKLAAKIAQDARWQ